MATNNGKSYNWETYFVTAKSLMAHRLTDRVEAMDNLKCWELQVLVDGSIVNTYSKMPVKEYESLLLGIEEYANKLQRKDTIKKLLGRIAVYILMAICTLAFIALCGENDEWSLCMLAAQKSACFAVMGGCFLSIKHIPVLAAAWKEIDNKIKE